MSVKIKAGKLREQVKKGELKPQDVLAWLRKQDYQSPYFLRWLQRR